jgi:hypothetical protein
MTSAAQELSAREVKGLEYYIARCDLPQRLYGERAPRMQRAVAVSSKVIRLVDEDRRACLLQEPEPTTVRGSAKQAGEMCCSVRIRYAEPCSPRLLGLVRLQGRAHLLKIFEEGVPGAFIGLLIDAPQA